jgi:hypothetical protein
MGVRSTCAPPRRESRDRLDPNPKPGRFDAGTRHQTAGKGVGVSSTGVWDNNKALTIDEWHAAITENLPGLPVGTQCEPLSIAVARNDPSTAAPTG